MEGKSRFFFDLNNIIWFVTWTGLVLVSTFWRFPSFHECPKTKRTLKDFFHSCKTRLRVCIFSHSILPALKSTKKNDFTISLPNTWTDPGSTGLWRCLKLSKFKVHKDHPQILENIQHFLTIFTSSVKIVANSDGLQILKTLSHTSVVSLLSN